MVLESAKLHVHMMVDSSSIGWVLNMNFGDANWDVKKQPFRGVVRKRCSENIQQIYRRTPICNFIIITLRHGCSLIKLLHIFRTSFYKNTSGGLLLEVKESKRRVSGLHCLVSPGSADACSEPCHTYKMGYIG